MYFEVAQRSARARPARKPPRTGIEIGSKRSTHDRPIGRDTNAARAQGGPKQAWFGGATGVGSLLALVSLLAVVEHTTHHPRSTTEIIA